MNKNTYQEKRDAQGSGTPAHFIVPTQDLFYFWLYIIIFIGVILIGTFIIPSASAQNMSISSLNLMTQEDVLIYAANSSLIGTYNTSSVGIPLPASDFMLIIKPTAVSRFFDPYTMLEDVFGFIESNWVTLLFILVFLGIITKRV